MRRSSPPTRDDDRRERNQPCTTADGGGSGLYAMYEELAAIVMADAAAAGYEGAARQRPESHEDSDARLLPKRPGSEDELAGAVDAVLDGLSESSGGHPDQEAMLADLARIRDEVL